MMLRSSRIHSFFDPIFFKNWSDSFYINAVITKLKQTCQTLKFLWFKYDINRFKHVYEILF